MFIFIGKEMTDKTVTTPQTAESINHQSGIGSHSFIPTEPLIPTIDFTNPSDPDVVAWWYFWEKQAPDKLLTLFSEYMKFAREEIRRENETALGKVHME